MKLYDIPVEAHEIESALIENGGELTQEIEQRICGFLREGKDKIECGAMVVRSLEGEAIICRAEAERLTKRATSIENGADRLKGLILFAVDDGFGGKVKTARFTIWSQTSARTVSFELPPGAALESLPAEFLRINTEINKQALKEAYEAEKEIPEQIVVSERPGTRYLRIL